MAANRILGTAVAWLVVVAIRPALAQSQPASGVYRIESGQYSECCGIAGEIRYVLPNDRQGFVRLTFNPQSHLFTMTFLGRDAGTVFNIFSCASEEPIPFSFGYGFLVSDRLVFHVDPGPPPNSESWNFTVSNSFNALRIDGVVGLDPRSCADFPYRFSYSNVVARLVPPPRMKITEFSPEGALLFIQGNAGWTNVVEASSDLRAWTPIATNLMPASLCPICPYIVVRDTATPQPARRFYRCFEVP